ncbi:MAG: sigma 54-interacting transcriptional regulator [Proteobacteria bacterium]|nr:sigma 54-interacting transcriptional regulator [Pseudomonadota bacterium]
MLEIALHRAGRMLLREPIGTEPITVGRASENTIRLMDPDISREHCRIEWRDGALIVKDLSTNGMLVNGERVSQAQVDAGDRIAVGPWNLVIEATVDAIPVRTLAAEPHATRVLAFDPASKKLTTQRVDMVVRTPDQAPLKKRVSKSEILIGHHASCDVAVADPYVSRRHCKLVIDGERVKLIDLASTNGVFVGETRVAQAAMERHGSFRVGRSEVHYRLSSESEELAPSESDRLGEMVGRSRAMREVFALIRRVAPSDAPVLITGESGTGKELAARELHRLSLRRQGPFVAINCGALPAGIIEAQLFGHEKGAFTGAVERMPGLIEQAKGGTLFLDEIGEMDAALQTRLLRVLEDKKVRRIGAQAEIDADFRLVAATNRDLRRMAKDGRFREDLLYRIYVVPIEIPSLRERPDDIEHLASHFLARLAKDGRAPALSAGAMKAVRGHPWPGNARELRNAMERTLLLSIRDVIEPRDLFLSFIGTKGGQPGGLREQERSHLIEVIAECKGNISRSARRLGIARTSLQAKIRRFKIETPKP